MDPHADPVPGEGDSLDLQAEALLQSCLPGQCNSTTRPHHAVPGKSAARAECPDGQARRPRKSSGSRHLAVRDHFTPRHAYDHCSQPLER